MKINIEIPENEKTLGGWTVSPKWLIEFGNYLEKEFPYEDAVSLEDIETVIRGLRRHKNNNPVSGGVE